MVIECVLDASAVLALVFLESGGQTVEPLLPVAAISSVNASEVLAKLIDAGAGSDEARTALTDLHLELLPFDFEDAVIAAELRVLTRRHGLSFGDRACLAAAQRRGVPAVSADRNWKISGLPVQVRFLR